MANDSVKRTNFLYFVLPLIAISAIILLIFAFIPTHEKISELEHADVEVPLPPQMYSSSHQLIGTGNKLGTYFPMGNILAEAFNKDLNENGSVFKAIETNGSMDNIALLETGQITLGMSETRIAEEAYAGKEQNGSKLRAVWPLWLDVVHIVKTPEKYESQKKFPGIRRSFMGQKGSSTLRTTKEILKALNQQRTNEEVQSSEVIPKLSAGKLGYAAIQAGMPNKTVTEAVMFHDCALYSFSEEELKKIIPMVASSKRFVIPAKTYGEKQQEVNTIAIPNILVATEDTPNDYINIIVETLVKNAEKLQKRYSQLQTLPTNPKEAEETLSKLKMPIHSGTIAYFEELKSEASKEKVANANE